MSDPSFAKRIAQMNAIYKPPAPEIPALPIDPADRLRKFKTTLLDEVNEIDDIVAACESKAEPIDVLVAVADLLGGIIAYCRSEAPKFGLPLEDVLAVIMDSNESKLAADGKPIYDANGKFLKGPNYWQPEPKIKDLLRGYCWREALTTIQDAASDPTATPRSTVTVKRCQRSVPEERFFLRRG